MSMFLCSQVYLWWTTQLNEVTVTVHIVVHTFPLYFQMNLHWKCMNFYELFYIVVYEAIKNNYCTHVYQLYWTLSSFSFVQKWWSLACTRCIGCFCVGSAGTMMKFHFFTVCIYFKLNGLSVTVNRMKEKGTVCSVNEWRRKGLTGGKK